MSVSTQVGIVALLLVPMNDFVQAARLSNTSSTRDRDTSNTDQPRFITADLCRTYLMAFSRHVDDVLDLWRMARLESSHFANLMKVCEYSCYVHNYCGTIITGTNH